MCAIRRRHRTAYRSDLSEDPPSPAPGVGLPTSRDDARIIASANGLRATGSEIRMAVPGLYRRVLPSPPAIEFASSEGKVISSDPSPFAHHRPFSHRLIICNPGFSFFGVRWHLDPHRLLT